MDKNTFNILQVDYTNSDLPATVRLFKPIVFQDGKAYCCLLGPDPETGIFGCGFSKEEAINDWDQVFNEQLERHSDDEGIIRFIRKRLSEGRGMKK